MIENKLSKEEIIILLLQIIKNDGNMNHLAISGLMYQDIIRYIKELISNDYVKYIGSKLTITDGGLVYLMKLNKSMNRKGLYKFISPDVKNRTKRMDIEEIYIPLNFVKE